MVDDLDRLVGHMRLMSMHGILKDITVPHDMCRRDGLAVDLTFPGRNGPSLRMTSG